MLIVVDDHCRVPGCFDFRCRLWWSLGRCGLRRIISYVGAEVCCTQIAWWWTFQWYIISGQWRDEFQKIVFICCWWTWTLMLAMATECWSLFSQKENCTHDAFRNHLFFLICLLSAIRRPDKTVLSLNKQNFVRKRSFSAFLWLTFAMFFHSECTFSKLFAINFGSLQLSDWSAKSQQTKQIMLFAFGE